MGHVTSSKKDVTDTHSFEARPIANLPSEELFQNGKSSRKSKMHRQNNHSARKILLKLAWRHAKLILKTSREILPVLIAQFRRHFGHVPPFVGQQPTGMLHLDMADKFQRGVARDGFQFPRERGTRHVHGFSQTLHVEIAIGQMPFHGGHGLFQQQLVQALRFLGRFFSHRNIKVTLHAQHLCAVAPQFRIPSFLPPYISSHRPRQATGQCSHTMLSPTGAHSKPTNPPCPTNASGSPHETSEIPPSKNQVPPTRYAACGYPP